MSKTATVNRETRVQVLRRYSAGAELRAISSELNVDHEVVVSIVSEMGFQRARAGEALRLLDRPAPPAPAFSAPPMPEISVEPKPIEERTEHPIEEQHVDEPEPDPEQDEGEVEVERIDPEVLDEAEEMGGRWAARAAKIRADLVALADDLETAQAEREASEKVADLQLQLAEAQRALNEYRPKRKAGAPSKAGRAERDALREWAAAKGIEVPARGRIPQSVHDAYEKREDRS